MPLPGAFRWHLVGHHGPAKALLCFCCASLHPCPLGHRLLHCFCPLEKSDLWNKRDPLASSPGSSFLTNAEGTLGPRGAAGAFELGQEAPFARCKNVGGGSESQRVCFEGKAGISQYSSLLAREGGAEGGEEAEGGSGRGGQRAAGPPRLPSQCPSGAARIQPGASSPPHPLER